MTDVAPTTPQTPTPVKAAAPPARYDRSIVEGPLQQAVWKIAWCRKQDLNSRLLKARDW